MHAVPQQTMDLLKATAPFDQLTHGQLVELGQDVTVIYANKENAQKIVNDSAHSLFLISSGQFAIKDDDGSEQNLSEGDFFNCDNVINDLNYPVSIQVDSPGLIYRFETKHIKACIAAFPKISHFFQHYNSDDLYQDSENSSASMWLYRSISEVISHPVVSAANNISILDGVKMMAKAQVSSLLLTHEEQLVGIITDRDIRNRVVAVEADMNGPIALVMSQQPAYIKCNRTLFDALCVMTENNIHHLPVVDKDSLKPVGMLTTSDLIKHQRGNVLFLIDELAKASSLYELTRLSWQLPHYFAQHAKRLGDFDIAGKILSQATDIMTRRLIVFFKQQHGAPPMDFCWLVYGSQAREDQTTGSDQDNGLLLERQPNESENQYFEAMASYVCQGLGKCGIKLCDGNIMASNPQLRHSIEDAISEARQWAKQPTPKAILHFNIFLDVRAAAGNHNLIKHLQAQRGIILQDSIFLSALARHTNDASVPLSVFQKLIYKKAAKHPHCIDIKTDAIAIINNIVRVYALADGLTVPSTIARLKSLSSASQLSPQDNKNLQEIWLLLNRLRWRHQLSNKVTDNHLRVDQLSSIEKHQLKTAFKYIKQAQQGLLMKFSAGIS